MNELDIKERLIKFFIYLSIPIISGILGYYIIYGNTYSWLDYLYMTVITISTVGFSEIIDTSNYPEARILTMIILVSGMGIMLYAVSSITAFVVDGTVQNIWRRRKMKKMIGDLNDHIIVCGAGETGSYIIKELYQTKQKFVVIDNEGEVIEGFKDFNDEHDTPIFYIKGDATEEDTLEKAGIYRAKGLITALRDDRDNLFVTITAKNMNPNLRIIVRVANLDHKNKFFKAGADSVVSPNFIGGMRLVAEMIRPNVVTFLDSMLRENKMITRIEEYTIPPNSYFVDKSLSEAQILTRTGCLVLAIKEPGDNGFNYIPDPNIKLKPGTILVVLGTVEGIGKLKQIGG